MDLIYFLVILLFTTGWVAGGFYLIYRESPPTSHKRPFIFTICKYTFLTFTTASWILILILVMQLPHIHLLATILNSLFLSLSGIALCSLTYLFHFPPWGSKTLTLSLWLFAILTISYMMLLLLQLLLRYAP